MASLRYRKGLNADAFDTLKMAAIIGQQNEVMLYRRDSYQQVYISINEVSESHSSGARREDWSRRA